MLHTHHTGLMVWAHDLCRSTVSFYEALAQEMGLALTLATYGHDDVEPMRAALGLGASEGDRLRAIPMQKDSARFVATYEAHKDDLHLFGCYQNEPLHRLLMKRIVADGGRYLIMSESPCSMAVGGRDLLKRIYYRTVLPLRLRASIAGADRILNCSGDDPSALRALGWPTEKIIPLGYAPLPLPGSRFTDTHAVEPFAILHTGALEAYRGPQVFIEALGILSARGLTYTATITQDGSLRAQLEAEALRRKLPVTFTGRLPLPEVVRLYETCSVFVAAGLAEPWGMRLNDAINCGAPIVVSRGMGGAALVDRYGCGLAVPPNDPQALADALARLITNPDLHATCVRNARQAAAEMTPQAAARRVLSRL